ncbi:hypothetical protein GCM10018963_05050 [Saccharothrix longispora]
MPATDSQDGVVAGFRLLCAQGVTSSTPAHSTHECRRAQDFTPESRSPPNQGPNLSAFLSSVGRDTESEGGPP